jgi:hypothetical protein
MKNKSQALQWLKNNCIMRAEWLKSNPNDETCFWVEPMELLDCPERVGKEWEYPLKLRGKVLSKWFKINTPDYYGDGILCCEIIDLGAL